MKSMNVKLWVGVFGVAASVATFQASGQTTAAVDASREAATENRASEPQRDAAPPRRYVEDKIISTKIRTQYVGDSTVKMRHVKVKTFNGTVQLSGFVDNQGEMDRAVEIAQATVGVKSVKNDIRFKTAAQ